MSDGINFGHNRPWGAVSQVEQKRMARDEVHPLPYRVYFAALGRANRSGHAEFSEGELREILSDGTGRRRSAQSVSNAIAEAKERQLLHRDSQASCLVLGPWHFQKAGKGSRGCDVHRVPYAA